MTGCNSETVNTASDAALFTSESNVSGIKEAEDDSDEKSSSELDATAAQDFEAAPAEEGLKKNTEPTEDAMDNTAEAQNQQGLKTDNNIAKNNSENVSGNQAAKELEDNNRIADVTDEEWIANRVLELLNEERKAAGIHTREMLTGLNKVAVLRSEQLVTQFSHKWIDEDGNEWSGAQYASTVLKYGKKEQSSIYDPDTGTVTPIDEYYYDYGGTENCYYGGTAVKSKSETAESIVNSFKGSQSHWSSLMSSSMFYDGIGITFCNGMVYCSVNSSAENYG